MPGTWDYLETHIDLHLHFGVYPTKTHGRLVEVDGWLDRSPDSSYCIWWWGDKSVVEEYKKWGDKLYGLLSDYPDLVPVPSWLAAC